MVLEMKIPSPGESITEVEISQWMVKDGDIVSTSNAISGSHFLQEGMVKQFVSQFKFENEISSLYLHCWCESETGQISKVSKRVDSDLHHIFFIYKKLF